MHARCVLVIGLCVALPSLVEAADTLARLGLVAQVPLLCQLAVEVSLPAQTLDLARAESNLFVASIRETCNSAAGYTVTLSSLGDGRLRPESREAAEATEPASIPYELRYDGARAALFGSGAQPTTVSDVRGRTGALGVQKAVAISYRPAPPQAAGGLYSDILVLTIAPR